MTDRVRITDVAPRDGLQNEPGVVSPADKARLAELLLSAGVDEVELTSFVKPGAIPQLADAEDVCRLMSGRCGGAGVLSALVPNERGLGRFAACLPPLGKAAVFTAASETFCEKNIGCSIEESIERFEPVIAGCRGLGVPVRGYVSCVAACPYEGPVDAASVGEVCAALLAIGVDELDLGDTIGAAMPETIGEAIVAAAEALDGRRETTAGDPALTLHLHDTRGAAAECVRTALDMGVRSFDGSVAGLGGCPFASTSSVRAPGNIATDTLVRTIEDAGFTTGVERHRLAEATAFAARIAGPTRAGTHGGPAI